MDSDIRLREPTSTDAMSVFALVERCKPLDPNSLYCNLLQCSHFSSTCIIAAPSQDPPHALGFVSAYVKPDAPDTLFVWQVAVDNQARGQGLASRMLTEILQRPALDNIRYIETTITADNQASQALFAAFAKKQQAEMTVSTLFDRVRHFDDQHDTELLHRIGPLR